MRSDDYDKTEIYGGDINDPEFRRKRKILERVVENALIRRVKTLGGTCEKFVSPGRRAVPDRLVTLPGGKIIFVECKAPGEKPTPIQKRDHAKRRKMGCDVRVIDTPEDADAFPDETNQGD